MDMRLKTLLDLLATNPRGDGESPLRYGQSSGEIRGKGPGESRNPMALAKEDSFAGTLEDRIAQGVFDGSPMSAPVAGYYLGGLAADAAMKADEGDYKGAAWNMPELAMFAGIGANRAALARTKTGTFVGADGITRTEFNPGTLKPKGVSDWRDIGQAVADRRKNGARPRLYDFIDAPDLAEVYPQAMDLEMINAPYISGPYPVHYRAPGQVWMDKETMARDSQESVRDAFHKSIQGRIVNLENWQPTVKSPSLHPGFENLRATGKFVSKLRSRLLAGEKPEDIVRSLDLAHPFERQSAHHYTSTMTPDQLANVERDFMQSGIPATSKEINKAMQEGAPLPPYAMPKMSRGVQSTSQGEPAWRIPAEIHTPVMAIRDRLSHNLWAEVLTRNAVKRDVNGLQRWPVRETEDVSPVDIMMRINAH